MLFSWPFVSFTTSSAPHALSGQMEMLIPQATALATHPSCFRPSKASGSISGSTSFWVYSWFFAWGAFHELPSRSLLRMGGPLQTAGHFVPCRNAPRCWGPVPCWPSCAPIRGCQPEKDAPPCNLATQRMHFSGICTKTLFVLP